MQTCTNMFTHTYMIIYAHGVDYIIIYSIHNMHTCVYMCTLKYCINPVLTYECSWFIIQNPARGYPRLGDTSRGVGIYRSQEHHCGRVRGFPVGFCARPTDLQLKDNARRKTLQNSWSWILDGDFRW